MSKTANAKDVDNVLMPSFKLKCKNIAQKEFAKLIKEKEIVLATGPAGVGKSYVAVAVALELLKDPNSPYTKLLIAKPPVEVDSHNLGFLPGDIKEKMSPYMESTIDIVDSIITRSARVALEAGDVLRVEPISFLRGKTLNNAIFIMEEAQNSSPMEIKTLLSRIGFNSKMIISGDLDQSDRFRNVKHSGLYDAMTRHINIDEIGFFTFVEEDIVRNPLITKILLNYRKEEGEENEE